jgi:hypothetical protein
MDDTYVYVSVKLYLKEEQTEDSIQEIIMDMDYSFAHDDIISHEIIDILDCQIPSLNSNESRQQQLPIEDLIKINPFDPFEA